MEKKNFQQCLWSKHHFDKSVSQLSDIVEASDSKEDCIKALRNFLVAEDIQQRLETPNSGEPSNQASQVMRKSEMLRAEALRHEFLATMWFAEQYDRYSERLKNSSGPSPEREWLKQYSEARGRHTGQGFGYKSLFILYLVDESDPNSASFTPEMIETRKTKLRNARSDGLWFGKLYKQFGPGISYYITTQTKTA